MFLLLFQSLKRVHPDREEILRPVNLRLLLYDIQSCPLKEILEQVSRPSHAVILLVHYKTYSTVVFFENDHSSLIECSFCLAKEHNGVIIVELREDPLHPNTVILLLKIELL